MGGKGIRGIWIYHRGIFWNQQVFFALWKHFRRQITLGLKLQLSRLAACQKLFWPTMEMLFLVVFSSGRSGGGYSPSSGRCRDSVMARCGPAMDGEKQARPQGGDGGNVRCRCHGHHQVLLPAEALCVDRMDMYRWRRRRLHAWVHRQLTMAPAHLLMLRQKVMAWVLIL